MSNDFRWYAPRWHGQPGGSGGPFGNNGNAANSFGDIIASVIGQYQQKKDEERQNALADALMNNGQVPGADPFVRRAVYPDGDQGDDPGPVPFASTDTPHSGGTSEMSLLAALQQQRDKAAGIGAKLAGSGSGVPRGRTAQPMSARSQWYLDNGYGPNGEQLEDGAIVPRRKGGSKKLPGTPLSPLTPGANPVDDPTEPGFTKPGVAVRPTPPTPTQSIYNSIMSLVPNWGGSNPNPPSKGEEGGIVPTEQPGTLSLQNIQPPPLKGGGPPSGKARKADESYVSPSQPGEAKPSPTPLMAEGDVKSVSSRAEAMALPPGTKFRVAGIPGVKIRP